MGLELEFAAGEGPRHRTTRCATPPTSTALAALDRRRARCDYVLEAVRLDRAARCRRDIPLIGFAGAPFTLACYAIEGGGSPRLRSTPRRSCTASPAAWHALMDRLADARSAATSTRRSAPGARRCSSSTAGSAASRPHDYREFVLPAHAARSIAALPAGVPRDPLRHRHRRHCSPLMARGGRRRHRRRLARRRWTRLGSASATTAPCRATWTRAVLLAPPRDARAQRRRRARPRRRPPRPHLQPRPRRPAADARGQRARLVDHVHERTATAAVSSESWVVGQPS